MAANADEIRRYVVQHYIQPAIRKDERTKEVYFRELEKGLRRGHDRAPYRQAIKAALTTEDFQTRYKATANGYTSITFTLGQTARRALNQPKHLISPTGISEDSSFGLTDLLGRNQGLESKEEIIRKLTERIDELTQDEFENLVRAYAQAKGFSNVELSFVLKFNE